MDFSNSIYLKVCFRRSVSNQQSAISYQLSAISNQQSAISYQLSAISYQPLAPKLSWHRLWPWPKGHATRMATLCERRCDERP
ncbi:MAG: hypothetical protein F6K26_46485 [Moorea sp. SIO2I5]|nr:hypothetical protein [Moorena sp. SIO2I5]